MRLSEQGLDDRGGCKRSSRSLVDQGNSCDINARPCCGSDLFLTDWRVGISAMIRTLGNGVGGGARASRADNGIRARQPTYIPISKLAPLIFRRCVPVPPGASLLQCWRAEGGEAFVVRRCSHILRWVCYSLYLSLTAVFTCRTVLPP